METLRNYLVRAGALLLGLSLSFGATAETTATITYFHNDIAGTPMLATDANGDLLWKENYQPYGDRLNNDAASKDNKVWFAGKPYDANTGLSYMGARYYNPTLGRFMGVDSEGVAPGNLHSFNRYAYANNNPYKFVDPDGHSPIDIGFLIYDLGKLAQTMRSGEGLGEASFNVAASVVGVIVPIPGAGVAIKATVRGVSKSKRVKAALAAMNRGRASEARILKELGLAKNKKGYDTSHGRTIPDAVTDKLSIEIKDVKRLARTKQIRIQTRAAKDAGRQSILYVGEKTCVNKSCRKAFNEVKRRSDLGPR